MTDSQYSFSLPLAQRRVAGLRPTMWLGGMIETSLSDASIPNASRGFTPMSERTGWRMCFQNQGATGTAIPFTSLRSGYGRRALATRRWAVRPGHTYEHEPGRPFRSSGTAGCPVSLSPDF